MKEQDPAPSTKQPSKLETGNSAKGIEIMKRPIGWLSGLSLVVGGYLSLSSNIWEQLDTSKAPGSSKFTLFIPFLFLLGLAFWLIGSGLRQFLKEMAAHEDTWDMYRDEENKPKAKQDPTVLSDLKARTDLHFKYGMLGIVSAVFGSLALPATQIFLMPFLAKSAVNIAKWTSG